MSKYIATSYHHDHIQQIIKQTLFKAHQYCYIDSHIHVPVHVYCEANTGIALS